MDLKIYHLDKAEIMLINKTHIGTINYSIKRTMPFKPLLNYFTFKTSQNFAQNKLTCYVPKAKMYNEEKTQEESKIDISIRLLMK